MSEDKKNNIDVNLKIDGLPEISESVGKNVTEIRTGIQGFLGRICNGAASEIGLILEDKAKYYRVRNALTYMAKLQKHHDHLDLGDELKIHPKILLGIAEGASLQDKDDLQAWWVGITISSMKEDPNDENLPFVNTMKELTTLQAKIFELGCLKVKAIESSNGLIMSEPVKVTFDELVEFTNCNSLSLLDREADMLRKHGLIDHGFSAISKDSLDIDLAPSTYGLEFFARCNGHFGDLLNFYERSSAKPCKNCGMFH